MPSLVLIAAAWIAGLVIAHHWLVPWVVPSSSVALLCAVPLAAILFWRQDRLMRLSSMCALALLAGAIRYESALPSLDDPRFVAHYNEGGWVTLEGIVRGYPDVRDTWTNLPLATEAIEIDGQEHPIHGTVLVRAPLFPEYWYGDRLRVSGLLETPPEFEGFSYRAYLQRQGVYSLVRRAHIEHIASGAGSPFWAAIYAVKDRARDVLARLVPEPEAALMQGIILGIESGIPRDLYDDYNTTGTSHIIVISGANITIVATLFALTFGRILGKRRAYWFTMAGIALYVLLVGADAAVVRAGVMGGLLVTAIYLGRRATAYVSLFAAALVLTMINPLSLWDVGFQLSFAATLGIILFSPPIETLFERGLTRVVSQERARQAVRLLNDVLIITLAAQILTLPLVIYYFGRLSLVSPLANLLILPLQPFVMSLGGAAALSGLAPCLEPLAQVISWIPWLCLAYTNAVVRWMAAWPSASLQIGQVSSLGLILYYTVVAGGAWLLLQHRQTAHRAWNRIAARASTTILLGVALVAAILAWLAILQLPDGDLHVAFLDVGQGDASLITTPQGQQILVDGGPSPAALTSALGQEMPFWDRSLDLVVMTHSDADHITGLAAVLQRFRVDAWLDNGQPDDDSIYVECNRLLEEKELHYQAVQRGSSLELGEGIVLEVLHPPSEPMLATASDSNNNSIVLRLSWHEAQFLFTGDIEAEAEALLLEAGLPLAADVLKVSHHGSDGSSTPAFLSAVAPRFAVISAGADNRFGHPHPAVLERLERSGAVTILRTDESGTVEFITDGQRLWVRTER
jgi:competence protein ComEC